MAVLTHWTKVFPATAGAVLVGAWANPAQAFFPSYLPDIVSGPPTSVPLPPPTINIPTGIPVPPVSPPPFTPPVPPPNTDTSVPPPPPCCCDCNNPTQTPEPATLVTGLIGLGAAGAASRGRRWFGGKK